jgi:hypothetical protein
MDRHDDGPLDEDRDLAPLFFMVWVASLVRVLGALLHEETFGTEATLALLFVAALPWPFVDAIKAYCRRRARCDPSGPNGIKKV